VSDGDGDGKTPPLDSAAEQRTRDARGRFGIGNRFGFQPGQSGSPGGRRRGIKAIFEQAFAELAEEAEDPKQREQLKKGAVILAKALILEGLRTGGKQRVQALEKALDRAIGKVPQPFRIAMPDEDDERASFTDLEVLEVTREDVERERRLIASGNGDDPSEEDVPE
jgi:hypothetical protein